MNKITSQQAKTIGAKTQFKKGKSGNPKGRPKKLPQLDELLADVLCEKQGGMTAARAILKRLTLEAISGNVQAAALIMERAYGKVKAPIEIFNPDGTPIKFGYGDEKPV